jgi:hypothetical protein
MSLPVLAEIILGESVDFTTTVKNSAGAVQASPNLTVLAAKRGGDPVILSVVSGVATFTPDSIGTFILSFRVTSPVKAVKEGIVRVVASAIS